MNRASRTLFGMPSTRTIDSFSAREAAYQLCLMISEGLASEIIATLCPAGAGCATHECRSVLVPHQSLGTSTLELLRP